MFVPEVAGKAGCGTLGHIYRHLPMGASTALPLRCRGSRIGKTPFERNLLPGFAHWVAQEIERGRPTS